MPSGGTIRNKFAHQNGWIFRKVPKGPPHLYFVFAFAFDFMSSFAFDFVSSFAFVLQRSLPSRFSYLSLLLDKIK